MSKRFRVEPGYLARVGVTWFDDRVLMIVEEDERVEVHVAVDGKPGPRLGSYDYEKLSTDKPPTGLRAHGGL